MGKRYGLLLKVSSNRVLRNRLQDNVLVGQGETELRCVDGAQHGLNDTASSSFRRVSDPQGSRALTALAAVVQMRNFRREVITVGQTLQEKKC